MHKMHKRNEIMKNSCKWTPKATAVGRKRKWKTTSQLSKSAIQSKARRIHKSPKH